MFRIGKAWMISVSLLICLLGVAVYSCGEIKLFSLFASCMLVWLVAFLVTTVSFHKLLQLNKPLEIKPSQKSTIETESNSDQIKQLVQDIDKYFISKWYVYISNDKDFPCESRLLLEEVIKHILKIQLNISTKGLFHCGLNIYLKHLKEFRRFLKRKEKFEDVKNDDLYRYSHICSGNRKSKEYFVHQLTTNLLNHFINWELWNSLPCQVLVSILARKLTLFFLNLLSNPEVLNYYILTVTASQDAKNLRQLQSYSKISLKQFQTKTEGKNGSNKGSQEKLDKEVENEVKTDLEEIGRDEVDRVCNKKENFVEEHVLERTVSEPVKIYEPKSSSKTWADTQDLAALSFGHDPLDFIPESLEKEKPSTFKSLFRDSEESPTAADIIINEVKHMTSMEGLKSSIKPISEATVNTFHNIKDLQETTVNNALHKIGDFQDEAAGVVEGLLDFGRAGLRKGLRLTGLQDNIENAKAAITSTKRKLTRADSQEKSSSESGDSVWVNPLQIDSPNFDGHILLEKPKDAEKEIEKGKDWTDTNLQPLISIESESESPDPEYEEPADLESTIAKLRSLLQQRSSESNMSTPAISPMPPEDFTHKVINNSESNNDLIEVDGVMPSFYKFCAKTATGVIHNTLNTIKTALPGSNVEIGSGNEKWIFIQADHSESDMLNRMGKLLTERKEFCKVDTAYEAYETIDTLDSYQQIPLLNNQVQFDDELDDFEVRLPITKALMDIICELLADTDSPLLKENMNKALLLVLGKFIESYILETSDGFMKRFNQNLFTIPESTIDQTLEMDFDDFINDILTGLPKYIWHIFEETDIRQGLRLFVYSLQERKMNEDIFLQLFELLAVKLIEESAQTPPASA